MQTTPPRIWTRIAVYISYDSNHYTTDTSSYNKLHTIRNNISEERETNMLMTDDNLGSEYC